MFVAAAGGAAVGAAVGSRLAERDARYGPAVRAERDGATDAVRQSEQHVPVAAVQPAQRRASLRRRTVVIAYGIAVVLMLSGVGVIGVAAASQQQPPPPPPAPPAAAVAAPAEPPSVKKAPARVTAPARASFGNTGGAQRVAPEPQQVRVAEPPAPLSLPPSRPVTLHIPSIDVRSEVRHLGLTDEGELETPSGRHYDDAAWYRHSPTPGSLGPSILLGHVDSAENGPSVFFRLGELRAGDRVTVTRADGSAAVFVVDEVRSFAKKNFPTKLVYGDIDHAGLRILTCGGPFDEVSGHYVDNVVVFASLVAD